jgi:hypothetical protein
MSKLDSRASHESPGSWRKHWVEFAGVVIAQHLRLGLEVLDGKPKRIKFNRDQLSVVNLWIDIKLAIRQGETRTSWRCRGWVSEGICVELAAVMRRKEPSLTMIYWVGRMGRDWDSLPASGMRWDEAPESMYHCVEWLPLRAMAWISGDGSELGMVGVGVDGTTKACAGARPRMPAPPVG